MEAHRRRDRKVMRHKSKRHGWSSKSESDEIDDDFSEKYNGSSTTSNVLGTEFLPPAV